MGPMAESRPPSRRRVSDVAPGASTQMAKTAGLVLVAVVVAIIMLNVIDDNPTPKSGASGSTSTTSSSSTTSHTGTTTTHTTVSRPRGPVLPPAQVRYIVLNAQSGVSGAAKTMTDALVAAGYTNHDQPTDTTPARQGTDVACRPGLSREAHALAIVVGQGASVVGFPNHPPATVDSSIKCIVYIGKPAATTTTVTTG